MCSWKPWLPACRWSRSIASGDPARWVTDGHDSLMVKAGDVPALARSLATVIRDPNLRERLGRNALQTAQKYSLDLVMADWDRVLRDGFCMPATAVLANSRSSGAHMSMKRGYPRPAAYPPAPQRLPHRRLAGRPPPPITSPKDKSAAISDRLPRSAAFRDRAPECPWKTRC